MRSLIKIIKRNTYQNDELLWPKDIVILHFSINDAQINFSECIEQVFMWLYKSKMRSFAEIYEKIYF